MVKYITDSGLTFYLKKGVFLNFIRAWRILPIVFILIKIIQGNLLIGKYCAGVFQLFFNCWLRMFGG